MCIRDRVVAALSVSGFFKDFSPDKIPEISSSLQKIASSISQDLGGYGDVYKRQVLKKPGNFLLISLSLT